jgi:Zn-dependent M28 family amino/carboxypeptidase
MQVNRNVKSMKKKLLKAVFTIVAIIGIFITAVWIYIAQPTPRHNSLSSASVDMARLKEHVRILTEEFYPRNYQKIQNLSKSKEYIARHFQSAGAKVSFQDFEVSGRLYSNVIAVFGEGKGKKRVVGAHYDSYEDTPGADDNASGIAGLIELAYLLGTKAPGREVELVAYTLEEPPYFDTMQMGSYIHAESLSHNQEKPTSVIVLEMIGYFSDAKHSQDFPVLLFKLLYPDSGNFIGVIGRLDQRELTKKVKIAMKGATDLPVYSLNAPKSLPGVDFSDHRSYWTFGMNAVMITDTAFYRNKQYHQAGDTKDRLDYDKMAKVVVSVFEVVNTNF